MGVARVDGDYTDELVEADAGIVLDLYREEDGVGELQDGKEDHHPQLVH